MTSMTNKDINENNISPKRIYGISIAIFAIAGVALCLIMLNMYAGAGFGTQVKRFFCGQQNISHYGCTGVFLSRYGKFLSIPWPIWGMLYFAGILCWLIIFGRKSFNILFYLWLIIGFITSTVLLAILLFLLKGQCHLCMLAHLCNLLIIIISVIILIKYRNIITQENIKEHIVRALLVIAILASISGWIGVAIYKRQAKYYASIYEKLRTNETFQLCLYQKQQPKAINITKSDHILGSRHADVVIVVYKDFQCPVCFRAWHNIKSAFDELNKEYPDKIAIVVRHWPLSNICNPYINVNMHPYACSAARSAEAIYQLAGNDAFWKYHELLVQHHNSLDTSPYVKLAKQIGIPEQNFLSQIKSASVDAKIKADIESGEKLKISGVPAIFINGRYIDVSWNSKTLLKEFIRTEIKKHSKNKIKTIIKNNQKNN